MNRFNRCLATAILLPTVTLAQPLAFEADHWGADAHEIRGNMSHDTVLAFERIATGVWNVQVDCQVTDTRTRKHASHKSAGRAHVEGGLVLVTTEKLGHMVLKISSGSDGRLTSNDSRCATGSANIGTGD